MACLPKYATVRNYYIVILWYALASGYLYVVFFQRDFVIFFLPLGKLACTAG